MDRTNMAFSLGDRIRRARLAEGLSQTELARKMGVAQPTISTYEIGKIKPDRNQLVKLEGILGRLSGPAKASGALDNSAVASNAIGVWLRQERNNKNLSVPELSRKAKLSAVAIYNIEAGKSQNPQEETRKRLEEALGVEIPNEVKKEVEVEQEIEGFGPLTDFDPHDQESIPRVPGVYVFYDISDRPVYIGKAQDIAERVRDHEEKFWFKPPIVTNASYVEIPDKKIRHQVEQVLIKFLKSNAVINKQSVGR